MTTPFSAPSTLPYSLPPFGEIRDEHYEPAFLEGMEQQRAEIAAITADPQAPTFENTLVPLSGGTLTRVAHVFFNKISADSNDLTNALEEKLAPLLAGHHDAIVLDSALFARIAAVHEGADEAGLDAEQRYLVERWHTEMTIAGAGLDDADKETLRDLNQRISTLTTKFDKNLLTDTNELAVEFTDVADLDGLGAGEISAASEAAKARGSDDSYLVTLVLPTGHPYLASLTDHGVRERIMTASRARGIRGGEFDNRELVLEIARLRADRARLLG